jgi:hypothetical protein
LQRRKVVVSDEESEGTPLQDRRKARREQSQPQPFTTMLGLENPAQRSGCNPALLKRMRESGVLGEEGNQPVWDDVDMPPADPDLNFSFGNPATRAAGEKEKEDKIQASLRAKEERDRKKEETEKRAKEQVSVRQVNWPKDLVRQGEEIGERTTGGNIINPQGQQAAFNGNNEEKSEEVAGPDARDQVMTDAPPVPSILKRKEEASIPTAPLEESQESKKLRKFLEKKKKREEKQEAKRSASATARNLQEALASVGQKSES